MSINKPFYRIVRPFVDGSYIRNVSTTYILDDRYAPDRIALTRGFSLLELDLRNLFYYIEPADINRSAYSHRTYELLLRSCTEFEANCKAIMQANGYNKKGNFNIEDYYKLNSVLKLSEYQVYLPIWNHQVKIFKPFSSWQSSIYATLDWYKNYNNAKHSRNTHFTDANLESLINAVAATLILLFAQFNVVALNANQIATMYEITDGIFYRDTSLFGIKPPDSWTREEQYDFDWISIRTLDKPFVSYAF